MSFRRALPALLLLAALGCKKKEPEAPTPDPAPAPAPAASAPAPAEAKYGPILDAVHFESGGTTIGADQLKAIDAAAETLKTSQWTVLIVGLADASGDPAANKVISEQRAEAVAAELRKRVPDVPAERIKVIGVGEKLATGASQSERKVEFVFYEEQGLPLRQVVMRSGVLEEDFRAKRATR